MTKDGIREKVSDDLKRLYNSTIEEKIPPAWAELLKRLS